MHFHTRTKHAGRVRVTPWRRDDRGVWLPRHDEADEFPNLIVDAAHNAFRNALFSGDAATVDLQVKQFAFGTDATVPASGNVLLGAEFFRKQVTSRTKGTVGQVTTTSYIASGEANAVAIEEIGWFMGAATGVANSGTLLARVAYSRTKDTNEALQVDRSDTFS
jgi:hypothetical protein